MPQVNYTPIQLYRSSTPGATPSAGLLQNGELALNYVDGKLFYKDGAGTVRAVVTPDNSVTTAKIADANVTAGKLAIDSVTTTKIVNANVTADKLASGAALANIGAGGITATQLASGAALANIGAGGITATQLAANAVTTAKIVDANITAAKLDGAQSGSAPIYAARAWVNFNGTGTVAIRASGNVSSITDNGVGDYTVNFSTTMPDANYAVSLSGTDVSNGTDFPKIISFVNHAGAPHQMSTTGVRVGGTTGDWNTLCVAILR